ncbi:MAG: FimB/Mfa2 family fimbrial subunit, partial [Prevotellaceae bacterium]|nr:FimB/Mfa2 family fimbrial subunit [Prevotellaceae bacterium]
MNEMLRNWSMTLCVVLSAVLATSCDMMHEDTDDCPIGLYITFKYDYNLQRADMFNDHVGSVTLYVFDENGNYVTSKEESNTAQSSPLASPTYTMHLTDLTPGKYKFIALAGQKPYSEMLTTSRAKFVRDIPAYGDPMENLNIQLDRTANGSVYDIVNNSLPLDTLWHGMETDLIEVSDTRPTYDTISLVRDTKKINVTLRELSDPTTMDVADYDMKITDRNSHILYDNSLDESDVVVYTPHSTWNTEDRDTAYDSNGNAMEGVGKIAHADFMTSRILYH